MINIHDIKQEMQSKSAYEQQQQQQQQQLGTWLMNAAASCDVRTSNGKCYYGQMQASTILKHFCSCKKDIKLQLAAFWQEKRALRKNKNLHFNYMLHLSFA